MKLKNVNKKGYSFTVAELIIKANIMKSLFRRDEQKFALLGVKAQDLMSYEQKIIELERLPSDLEMETFKMTATQSKRNLAGSLKADIKRLGFLAKLVYQADDLKLRPYFVETPSELTDMELSYHSDYLARTSKRNIADFVNVNLTEADCDEIIARQVAFKESFIDVNEQVVLRDSATENRWLVANEVYKQMAQYCEIGKFIWESVSEASYNDYVLYPNSSSSNSAGDETPEVIEVDTQGDGSNPFNG